MASNNDNPDEPELVDLLYDDELDDQTAGRLRSKIQGSSPEDAAELESYEQMLERVRETETEQEVSREVHDAIVDTAREHATRRTEQAAHPETPTPSPSGRQHTETLWGRLTSGTKPTRLGTAAAALLACGTILYVMRGEVTPTTQPTTETASKSSSSAPAEGVGEAPPETSDLPAPTDQPPPPGPSESDEAASGSNSDEPSRNALEVLRGDDSDETTGSGQPSSADEADNGARVRRRQPTPPARDDEPSSAPTPNATEQESEPQVLGDSPEPESAAPEDESAETIDPFGSGRSADSSKGKPAGDDKTAAASKSAAADSGKKSEKNDKPGNSADNRLVDVETAYLNDNWAETVKGVDLLLASDDLEPSDEARALELKGRALEQQDKVDEAHSVFTNLAERFPDYKSSVIESAIERTTPDRRTEPASSGGSNNDSSLNIFRGD